MRLNMDERRAATLRRFHEADVSQLACSYGQRLSGTRRVLFARGIREAVENNCQASEFAMASPVSLYGGGCAGAHAGLCGDPFHSCL